MANQNEKSQQSGGLKSFIFASIGVGLIGVLFGFFLAAVVLPTGVSTPADQPVASTEQPAVEGSYGPAKKDVAEADEGEAEKVGHGPLSIVRMQPIVTNLSDTAEVWVRLEASMLFDSKSEENPDLLAAKLSQHVLAYLRGLKLSDLQGRGAVNAIVQDLNEITTTMSEGHAQGVLISGLVFE